MKKILYCLTISLSILGYKESLSQNITAKELYKKTGGNETAEPIKKQDIADINVVEITDKLGVSTTANILSIELDKTLPEIICKEISGRYGNPKGFVVKLEDSAYVFVPFQSFKDATFSSGSHTVTLRNATTFKGTLIGKMKTGEIYSSENERKTYDLKSISSIRLVKLDKDNIDKPKPPKKLWTLSCAKPNFADFIIADPLFAFGYRDQYKSGGIIYTWETGTFVKVTQSFIIKTNNEEISANLSDFKNVSLVNDPKQASRIEITSPSGITTTGPLVLKYKEEEKNIDNIGWALVARVPDMADATLILLMPNLKFKESSGSQ